MTDSGEKQKPIAVKTSEKFEKALECINTNDQNEFFALVRAGLDLEEVDDHGTSLLQHASFRARPQMVQFMIKNGCDVNRTKHEHQYHTLHFGALSGDIDTVAELLVAGTKTDVENSVKRTPAEMAAFTGQTHVASFIKSYFHPDVFLKYQDSSVGASLQCDQLLALSLHKISTNYNIHPVRLTMLLKDHLIVPQNITVSVNILECERDKQFKKENNEVLSLRLHFLAYLLQKLNEISKLDACKGGGDRDDSCTDWSLMCDNLIKWFMKPVKSGGTKDDNIDRFVKMGLKQYPYTQNSLLQQAVKTISATSSDDDKEQISPISVYLQILTGSQAAVIMSDSHCVTCSEKLRNHLRCSRCKEVQYCDKKCQAIHWVSHKKNCKAS